MAVASNGLTERAKLAMLSQITRATGLTSYNLMLLRSLTRPEWLYRGGGRIPFDGLEFTTPDAVDDEAVALSQRLIDAYSLAVGDVQPADQTDGMWSWIIDTRQRDLAQLLQEGDAARLARLLASMFRQECIVGIAPGNLVDRNATKLGERIWWMTGASSLLSLAEALGVVRAENPEQGLIGYELDGGLDLLAGKIENALGISIDFPAIGAAYGLRAGGRLIPNEAPDQIYGAFRLQQAIGLHLNDVHEDEIRIVEIGAGYGGMAAWFLQLQPGIAGYTVVDLPLVNVMQGYFLSRALGPGEVSLWGEPTRRVAVVPNSGLAEIEPGYHVLANKDSMPEIPHAAVTDYLEWARKTCSGIVFSYNQEAHSPFLGEEQTHVPTQLELTAGFERLRRDSSWLRRGYAEEIWRLTGQ